MRTPFERAVAQHGATVLRVCRAALDPHDADDAWSATFLAAMQAWADLPDDANVQAWLVTIAHRKAIDVVRAAGRAPLPVAELPDRPTSRGIPDGRDLDLADAVRHLPDRQRAAVTLHHLGGLPYADVAELIGGTPDAARRAASDGVHSLRRLLAPATNGSDRP